MRESLARDRVKSKTVSVAIGIELVVETRLNSGETAFVNERSAVAGVSSAVLVSYHAELSS